jgi:hypothetical protein
MGGYCWRQPPGSSGGGGLSVCASVLLVAPFPHESLVVRPGEELTLRFDPALRPESATITRSSSFPSVSDQNVAAANGSPLTFRADFPEGEHYVMASVKFAQGTAPYIFRITVRPAPAPGPTPGPVRFTG